MESGLGGMSDPVAWREFVTAVVWDGANPEAKAREINARAEERARKRSRSKGGRSPKGSAKPPPLAEFPQAAKEQALAMLRRSVARGQSESVATADG